MYEKGPQTLSQLVKLVEKLNAAQQVTATLSPHMVNMMSNDDNCFTFSKKGHICLHCPQAKCYTCDDFGHIIQDCPKKISTCIITTTTRIGHNPYITDTAKGMALTGKDHGIDPHITEAPVSTRGMHPTPYLIITAILGTPLQIGTLEDTPAAYPDTCHTRATPDTTSLISLAPGTPQALPIYCTQGRY